MRNLLVLLAMSLLASACDAAAQIIPDVDITAARVGCDAHVAGVVGVIPWSLDAKATPNGAVVCLSVLLWETCQEVP